MQDTDPMQHRSQSPWADWLRLAETPGVGCVMGVRPLRREVDHMTTGRDERTTTAAGARGGPLSGVADPDRPLADLGRRAHPSTLPATGAWQEGDAVGNRRFVPVSPGRPFALDCPPD